MNESQKKTQIRYKSRQLRKLTKDMEKTFDEMLSQALSSGALTEEMLEDNFILAKAIIDIWCGRRTYKALADITKMAVANLSHFI